MRAPFSSAGHSPLRRLALLGAVCVVASLSCNRDVTGPNGAARFVHGLSWNSIFPPPLRQAGLSSGVVDFNRVHVVLRHSDGTVALDSTIAFPAGADSLTVSLTVRLLTDAPATGEPMQLDLAYVDAAGDTVFKGGPIALTAAPPPASGGVNPPVQVPVVYTGPGASATSVVIAPRSDSVAAAAPFTFTAVTKDAGGNVVTGTPVIWTSLDPAIATISAPTAGTGVALNVRGTARIMAQLLSGTSDTVQVIVTLPAAQLVKPATASGDAQTGVVSTTLPLPIVAKVAASDGVGVAGTTVTFAVATGGGSVTSASVVSDANGLAQTDWKLGAAAGLQSVTATAGPLTGSPLTFTATATTAPAGPAASLAFTTGPSAAVAGAANTPAIVVHALDSNGLLATTFTGNVTLAIGANPGGSTLGGTVTVAAAAGVATFSGITLNKTGTGYTLTASSGTLTAGTSAAFNISAAAASALAITAGNAQTGSPGATLPTPLAVKVTDAFGNAVPGQNVTFTITTGGGTFGAATSTTVATDASGQATAVWTLGALLGAQTVTASSAGLTSQLFTATTSAAPHTWTGATSTAWTTPTNWSPASVPGSADSVFINTASNLPTLSASTTVGAIVVATGAPLTIGTGATLTVNGTFDATGGIAGAGTVVLAGSKTATGVIVGSAIVTGSYTVIGTFGVSGSLSVTSGGIVVNGNSLGVTGDFSTSGTGTLTMTNGADVVSITGNATFAGGSTAGHLTDGLLAVSGNFTQSGAASTFAPSGNNTVALVADAPQTVTVAAPGTAIFQNFISTNAQLVTIASPIVIQGNATIGGPVTTGTNPLTINGTLTDPAALLSTPALTLGNAVFPLAPSTSAIVSNVTFTGAGAALQAPLEVLGSVTVFGGNLAINGQQMAVAGPFVTTSGGTLTMNTPADTLLVGGEATFAGGPEAGLLTAGTLGIFQGLVVGGAGQFSASGSHVTYIAGPPRLTAACLCSAAPLASQQTVGAAAPVAGAAQPVATRRARAAAAAKTARAQLAALTAARKLLAAKWPSRAASVRAALSAGPAAVRAAKVAPLKISAAARARISANRVTLPALAALPALLSRAAPARAGVSRAMVPAATAPIAGATSGAAPARASSFTIPAVSDSAVYVAFGDTTGNHFASVRVVGTTNWETAAVITGAMLVDTTGFVEGNGHLSVGDTLFVSGSAAVEPEALELFGALADSGFYAPDTTLFSAPASQTMPSVALGGCPINMTCALDYGNVIVKSPALGVIAEDENTVNIFGSLFIVNSGQMRIGVPDSVGCFGCISDDVIVLGALETHGNGTLRMNDTNTPFLEVDDSAYFAGGSSAGLLTQGESDFFGNFRQAGSATAYVATSPHVSYFGASLSKSITFANASYANSHFGDMFIDDTAMVLNSSVFVDGQFQTGSFIGHTLTAGVAGVGLTSKGANIALVDFIGVTWDLQDGYGVTNMNTVAFDNESPTGTQFSIERGNTIPIATTFTNWSFSTRPTAGGFYMQVTQTDDGSLGPLTVTFSGVALGGNFGGINTIGPAIVTGWPLGGGGDSNELSYADNATGDRTDSGGTSSNPTGTLHGEWFRPVTARVGRDRD